MPSPDGSRVVYRTDRETNSVAELFSEPLQDMDIDSDGIENVVDGQFNGGFTDESQTHSDNFTDLHLGGTSFGTIVDRDGLDIAVADVATPAGLTVMANGGSGTATVNACGSAADISLTSGDDVVTTCGSLMIEVVFGPIELGLGSSTVTVPTNGIAMVEDLGGGIFELTNLSESVVFLVNEGGTTTSLTPNNSRTVNDSDGDRVLNSVDFCPGTAIPESVPTNFRRKNCYALTGQGVPDITTFQNTNKTVITTADTGGCSCEQIIAELGLGTGQRRFGCTKSAMLEWIDQVSP